MARDEAKPADSHLQVDVGRNSWARTARWTKMGRQSGTTDCMYRHAYASIEPSSILLPLPSFKRINHHLVTRQTSDPGYAQKQAQEYHRRSYLTTFVSRNETMDNVWHKCRSVYSVLALLGPGQNTRY